MNKKTTIVALALTTFTLNSIFITRDIDEYIKNLKNLRMKLPRQLITALKNPIPWFRIKPLEYENKKLDAKITELREKNLPDLITKKIQTIPETRTIGEDLLNILINLSKRHLETTIATFKKGWYQWNIDVIVDSMADQKSAIERETKRINKMRLYEIIKKVTETKKYDIDNRINLFKNIREELKKELDTTRTKFGTKMAKLGDKYRELTNTNKSTKSRIQTISEEIRDIITNKITKKAIESYFREWTLRRKLTKEVKGKITIDELLQLFGIKKPTKKALKETIIRNRKELASIFENDLLPKINEQENNVVKLLLNQLRLFRILEKLLFIKQEVFLQVFTILDIGQAQIEALKLKSKLVQKELKTVTLIQKGLQTPHQKKIKAKIKAINSESKTLIKFKKSIENEVKKRAGELTRRRHTTDRKVALDKIRKLVKMEMTKMFKELIAAMSEAEAEMLKKLGFKQQNGKWIKSR